MEAANEELAAALESMSNCLDSAISVTQSAFDEPPEPATEWDCCAGMEVGSARSLLARLCEEGLIFKRVKQE